MAFWFASRGKGITHIGLCIHFIYFVFRNNTLWWEKTSNYIFVCDHILICLFAPQPYHSQARVLLSGLGADEQLGGYSRHREAFRHGSWERLIQEVFFLKVNFKLNHDWSPPFFLKIDTVGCWQNINQEPWPRWSYHVGSRKGGPFPFSVYRRSQMAM